MQQELNSRFLYRGVNADLYRITDGKLMPKALGQKFERAVHYGEDVYYGDGTVYGVSEQNAVVMHQRDSAKFPTSGVSTTPIFENALQYTVHKHRNGFVYKIDAQLLDKYGVKVFLVDRYAVHPAIPNDQEIILVASDFGTLPDEIIIEIVEVTSPFPLA